MAPRRILAPCFEKKQYVSNRLGSVTGPAINGQRQHAAGRQAHSLLLVHEADQEFRTHRGRRVKLQSHFVTVPFDRGDLQPLAKRLEDRIVQQIFYRRR